MQVGLCRVSLRIPENHTLKGKRQVSLSLISKIRSRFNVSIAEVEDNDHWQRLTLGISCVSNEASHANSVLTEVVHFIQVSRGDLELLDYQIEVFPDGMTG